MKVQVSSTLLRSNVTTVDEGPSIHKAIDTSWVLYLLFQLQRHSESIGTRLSKYSVDFIQQPAYCASSSCRATIKDFYKVFIASIQVQMQVAVAGLPCWTVASVI